MFHYDVAMAFVFELVYYNIASKTFMINSICGKRKCVMNILFRQLAGSSINVVPPWKIRIVCVDISVAAPDKAHDLAYVDVSHKFDVKLFSNLSNDNRDYLPQSLCTAFANLMRK